MCGSCHCDAAADIMVVLELFISVTKTFNVLNKSGVIKEFITH